MNKIYLLIIFFLCLLICIISNTSFNYSKSNISNPSAIPNIDLKTELENLYHLNIYTKNETFLNSNFNLEPLTNDDIITPTLITLKESLAKFPPEFFNIFFENNYAGLSIYLTGKLTPKESDTTISDPAAFSLVSNSKYIMVIDITNSSFANLFYHELMHNIEFTLNNEYAFADWNSLNPNNFLYDLSYTKESNPTYTLNNISSKDIYFIDSYSKTYPDEDRARIFENICLQSSNITKYEHLYSKAKYLQEELLSYYPILKESSIFDLLLPSN